jgi:hypothetical protein
MEVPQRDVDCAPLRSSAPSICCNLLTNQLAPM